MAEEFKIKAVEGVEVPSQQEAESAVLEKAAEAGEIAPEAAGISQEDGHYKINLDQVNQGDNAIQERETETVDVGEQARDGEEVVEGVREQPVEGQAGESTENRENESPIEYIQDETSDGDDETTTSSFDKEPNNEESIRSGEGSVQQPELPEGLDSLVEFMKETGGTLEDYVHLNRDIDNMSGVDLIRESYKTNNPALTDDEVSFMMQEDFGYDEEVDSERDIKKKQIAFKNAVANAQRNLKQARDKYYKDLKFSSPSLTEEQQQAIQAYEQSKAQQELGKTISDDYDNKTQQFFNDFKGFEFKLNDKRVRYKVADVNKTKEYQMKPSTWMESYMDEKGFLTDPAAWHKAMYAAQNVDKIAQHFYDQGRADAVKQNAAEAKNIDMAPRQNASEVKVDGQKIRVVSGDDSDRLRFRIGKYR